MSVVGRLRKLEEKATEGPWVLSSGSVGTPGQEAAICGMPWSNDKEQKLEFRANAALIVTLRNALPLLADVVEAAESVRGIAPCEKWMPETSDCLAERDTRPCDPCRIVAQFDAVLIRLSEQLDQEENG